MDKRAFAIFFAAVLALAGVEESFQRVMTRNFALPDSNRIAITNPAGITTIRQSEGDEIVISYRLYADAGDFNQSRDMVTKFESIIKEETGVLKANFVLPLDAIEKMKFPYLKRNFEGKQTWQDRTIEISHKKGTELIAELEIVVPDSMEIEYDGMIGKVDLIDCSGQFNIELGTGEIRLENTSGSYNIKMSSGGMETENCSGSFEIISNYLDFRGTADRMDTLKVKQNSGSIEIDRADRITSFVIKSNSANVDISVIDMGCGNIESTSGDIELEIEHQLGCELNIESVSGDIEIESETLFEDERYYSSSGHVYHPEIESESHEVEIENPTGSGIIRIETVTGNVVIDY